MAVYKPKPVSGFPEWLPEERRIEQLWFDKIRKAFESYGYTSIETPSVEELEVLSAKGEVDKEIYVVERLHKDDNEKSEARLALHFDQTVPLARYVAQRFNDLDFPFKRYQMQRVWRGERPQAGRFREFYQCDIDVINVDALPLHFDAEMPAIMAEILQNLNIGKFQVQISNRKILMGLCAGLGITDAGPVTRAIDKIEKIGEDATRKLLLEAGLDEKQTEIIIDLAEIKTNDSSFANEVRQLSIENEMLEQGLTELAFVMDNLSHLPKGLVVADLSIVRGLDYYTGTVYETRFLDNPTYGSICSGGRYEDLAGNYINKKLPGVGISIGFSRLFDYMRAQKTFDTTRKSPTDILVALPSEEKRGSANDTARILRNRGFNVETYHSDQKIKKQMVYAEKKGIPFVWFPPFEDGQAHEIKNMTTGDQLPADPEYLGKTGMKTRIATLALGCMVISLPAAAAPFTYAPETCDFKTVFPEKPFVEEKCSGKTCYDVVTYTQTDAASSLNFRITCMKEDTAKISKTTPDELKQSLNAMAREAGMQVYGKDASILEDGTKTSVVIAGGTRNDKDVIYTGQIWIGVNSVLTLEAEMAGPANPKIEKSYMEILKSVGPKTDTAKPAPESGK